MLGRSMKGGPALGKKCAPRPKLQLQLRLQLCPPLKKFKPKRVRSWPQRKAQRKQGEGEKFSNDPCPPRGFELQQWWPRNLAVKSSQAQKVEQGDSGVQRKPKDQWGWFYPRAFEVLRPLAKLLVSLAHGTVQAVGQDLRLTRGQVELDP